jgi:pimeloyl-ACP methyl ester carboxylesterase
MRSLVLVHGWGADGSSWDAVTAHLPAGTDVVALDLLGHGKRVREPVPRPLTITALTDDLMADDATAAARPAPAVLVGHSMGGQVAVDAALRYPELVRALVLIDPALCADDAEMAGVPARVDDLRRRGAESACEFVDAAFPGRQPEELWRETRHRMSRMPGPVLADLCESMYLGPGALGPLRASVEALTKVAQPVFSLYSMQAAADRARAFELAAGSTTVVWPGTTHYLHQQRPADFATLLTVWLTEL